MFTRRVGLDIDAPLADVVAQLRAAVPLPEDLDAAAAVRRPRPGRGLTGFVSPANLDLSTSWRPSLLRMHYPVSVTGHLTAAGAGTRIDARIGVGFAVYFMLAGVGIVAAVAVVAALTGAWSPATALLVLAVGSHHLYSVSASVADAEAALRHAVSIER